jgi:hypothetical protein
MNSNEKTMEFLQDEIDRGFDDMKRIFTDLVVRITQYNEVNLEDLGEKLEESFNKVIKDNE